MNKSIRRRSTVPKPLENTRRRLRDSCEEGELFKSDNTTESSSENSSSKSSSSEEAFTEDEKSMVKRARKGNKFLKLRSGISEKSRSADIEKKCKWPSAMLDRIFYEKVICFKDLMLSHFVYGQSAIWQHPKTSRVEWKARELLLQRVIKNEPKLGFSKAKEIDRVLLQKLKKVTFPGKIHLK